MPRTLHSLDRQKGVMPDEPAPQEHLETSTRVSALFHYTTVEGAIGILTEQDFFLTDVRFTNDISELRHFEGFIYDRLAELLEKLEPHYCNEKSFYQVRKFALHIASS